MHPILIQWGPIVIPSWHAFFVIAALATFYFARFLQVRFYPQIPLHFLSNLFMICYLTSYFGSRLLGIILDQPDVRGVTATLGELFKLGPMSSFGGIIGVLVFGVIYTLLTNRQLFAVFDLSVTSGLLGLAIGRIGCFLNGDDFGGAVKNQENPPFWAVTFPNLDDGVARYPSQLIETAFCLGLVLLLVFLMKQNMLRKMTGFIGSFALCQYGIYRFLAEFLRGDERTFVFDGRLSIAQVMSIGLFVVFSAVLYWRYKVGQPASLNPQ